MDWKMRDFETDQTVPFMRVDYAIWDVKRVIVEEKDGCRFVTLLVALLHKWG